MVLFRHFLGGLRKAAVGAVQGREQDDARRRSAKGKQEQDHPSFPAGDKSVENGHGAPFSAALPGRLAELAEKPRAGEMRGGPRFCRQGPVRGAV